jgi:hypothetical protein
MEAIESAVRCAECRAILECPVLLPCSDSICKKHVTPEASEYYCLSCDVAHPVPPGGFPENKSLQILLNAKIRKTKFSSLRDSASEAFHTLSKKVHDAQLFQQDPYFLVNKKIAELKNETDIMRDEFKLSIDERADEIIRELNDYEQECKRNLKANDVVHRLDQLAADINAAKVEMDQWQKILNSFGTNEKDWTLIREKSSQYLNEFTMELNAHEDELLLNKLSDYRDKVLSFCKIQLQSDRK